MPVLACMDAGIPDGRTLDEFDSPNVQYLARIRNSPALNRMAEPHLDKLADRAPGAVSTVSAEGAAPASRPEARKPGLRTQPHAREVTSSSPGPDGSAQGVPPERGLCRYRQNRDVAPLRGLPPDRGKQLVMVVERDALPRHAMGQDALFECRVVEQREHGKNAVQQAVHRRG